MKYVSLKEQLYKERKSVAALTAEIEKKSADIDYIAMMCDIVLDYPKEESMMENETEED